jgi:hypothetical protein
MKHASGALLVFTLCFFLLPGKAARAANALEGFDLGMTVEEAATVIGQNKLKQYYEDLDTPGKVSRSYEGNILSNDNGTLDLVFLNGKLAMITASLEGETPELQQHVAQKYDMLYAEYHKLYGDQTESLMPGTTDWILSDRVVTLLRGETKVAVIVMSRGNVGQ